MTAENRLRGALDSMLDPFMLLVARRDGAGRIVGFRCVEANWQALDYYGVVEDEIVGASLADLVPNLTAASLMDGLVDVVETGEALTLVGHVYPSELVEDVLQRFDVRVVKVGDGVSMTWRDVTQRHAELERLARSEERYRLLAENSTDVILWTRNDVIEWVSPSVTPAFGWAPSELVGRSSAEVIHPDDRARAAAVRQHVYGGGADAMRLRAHTRDGRTRWVDIRSSPFRDAHGGVDGAITAVRDITDQVEAEEARLRAEVALTEREERYRLLAENASDLVYFADDQGRATWVAPTVRRSLGWSAADIVGRDVADLVHPDDWDVAAALREVAATGADVVALQPGAEHPILARMRAADGAYRWMVVTARQVPDGTSGRAGMVVGMRDVDELVLSRRLAERSKFDDLTGLANRSHLLDQLEQVVGGNRRTTDQHAVLYCDLDHFKEINDTYGHAAGDQVLRGVAERIRASVREGDIVARLGGDEFIIVLQGIRGSSVAQAVADKVRAAMREPLMIDGSNLACSVSIGVAMVRAESTPDLVLREADSALYRAKQSGRDRAVTHQSRG